MDALEFINLINPEHERTSCSDEDPCNGFYERNGETWHGRCSRCMMLEVLETGKVPDGFVPDEMVG